MLLKTIVAATSPWVRIPRPPLYWLFEVNRDGVSGWLPGVFSWRLRCVMGVLCRGCRQCGRADADWPGYGIRMPGVWGARSLPGL